ncbi:gtpase sar1 related small g protein [Vairimorpha apis BRL 01]|uniref:Gtpase sar1 related small g protein n=1 Tax=Vairimorpha apis BRL 01 TaxID=1037528 RepID=T0L6Z6_9MICR|nr:gtpase sar1 related small g protein [Vairimorpha apis BRL 01]
MYNTISDKEEIFLVLNYILETNPRFGNKDIVYNICKKYITISGCKNETLKVIKKFYTYFNKYKVSTELLPLICTYLADEKIQSFTFCLIEDILKDLKCHKEKIISKEWSLDSFKDYFYNKNKSNENIKACENLDDEWDEEW